MTVHRAWYPTDCILCTDVENESPIGTTRLPDGRQVCRNHRIRWSCHSAWYVISALLQNITFFKLFIMYILYRITNAENEATIGTKRLPVADRFAGTARQAFFLELQKATNITKVFLSSIFRLLRRKCGHYLLCFSWLIHLIFKIRKPVCQQAGLIACSILQRATDFLLIHSFPRQFSHYSREL